MYNKFVDMEIVNGIAYVVLQSKVNDYCLMVCDGVEEGMTYKEVCKIAENDLKSCCTESGLSFFDVVEILKER